MSTPKLPQFSQIDVNTIESTVRELTEANLRHIDATLEALDHPSWENLIAPIEEKDDQLSKYWSPISHLNSVRNNPELREAYNACLPILANYATTVGQHKRLFEAVCALHDSDDFKNYQHAQQKILKDHLRDFKLSGIDLPPEAQKRYQEISESLSKKSAKFEENVLDCANAWEKHIADESDLQGLPQRAKEVAADAAKAKDKIGWLITLDFPSYHAIVTYADDRKLREELYTAYCTRASDQGPHDKKYDNQKLMRDILALRQEKAKLLGFADYTEYSLAPKMADNPNEVIAFLDELVDKTRAQAQREYNELKAFAKKKCGIEELKAWDMAYVSEKMRVAMYDISQEQLRPYFPVDQVLSGFFELLKRLFHIHFEEIKDADTWHDDVKVFAIHDDDDNNTCRGIVYIDLYARQKKRGGAWMDDCQVRRRTLSDELQLPIAFVTCNFSPASGGNPALLDFDEVLTLFHEFGHGLHHLLTKVEYADASGINGVAWDAVEFPSQFMEHWCWTREVCDLISGHVDTGEKLPQALFDKMHKAKNFQAGMTMLRQLEFSLFDFHLHQQTIDNNTYPDVIQHLLEDVRQQVAVVPTPAFNRFANGFSHIFAGGYAAGYYSYKWAEVLASDGFSRFEEEGLFNAEVGKSFLENILEKGGSEEPKSLFIAFRGREPKLEPLLRHCGIVATADLN